MSASDRKQELESILQSLGYGAGEFRITFLGGDISLNDRVELEIHEQRFDCPYDEIHTALVHAQDARQLTELLSHRGLSRRALDDG